jgi:serine/threonine-protein kinase
VSFELQQVDLSAGQLVAERYAIERELGKGGMGRVYLAHQRPFDRPVVIKIMHPKYLADEKLRQRFFNEARAASQLSHPNSVTVYDFGKTDDDVYFIAMEYVDGVTLRKEINSHGPMPMDRAVPIVVQIAQSLGEAHRKGIIHRDLKPENVMLGRPGTPDEFVKVLDFGIAKVVDNQAGITQTGSVFGTPGYMAPEQGRAEDIDATVDLYSLTCCLYEMLTGRMPFSGDSALQVMMKHQSEVVPELPERFGEKLTRFVRTGMAKHADERPPNSDDYVAWLLASLSEQRPDDIGNTPRSGTDRPSSGQFMRSSTPSPARQSNDEINAAAGREQTSDAPTKRQPTNSSPPPDNLAVPAPEEVASRQQKETRRVDSSPLRDEIGHADTRPSHDPDQLQTPGGSPRYASPETTSDNARLSTDERHSSPPARESSPPAHPSSPPAHQSSPSHPPAHQSSPSHPPAHQSSPGQIQDNPPTQTIPRGSQNQTTRYWAIAATVLSAGLAALLLGSGFTGSSDADQDGSTSIQSATTVRIESQPPGALVRVDGTEVGVTPTEYRVEVASTLDVTLSKRGYDDRTLTKKISPSRDRERVFASLDPRPIELGISAPVGGMELLINGESYGKLAANRARSIQLEWPEDGLRVVLRHPDYEDFIERIPPTALEPAIDISPDESDVVPAASKDG